MTIHRGSGGTNGTAVDNTDFVYLTSPTTGEVLQFDATTDRFLNKTIPEAGIQPTLVSGTNIKTINGESLLGTTNIPVTVAADIANMLETADIGSTVLAYDANLQSFVNTFTLPTADSTAGYVLATNGTGTLQLVAPVALPDGDKGDITTSASATVFTIDNGVVTTAKLGGDITTAGKALLDDATAAAQRTTLGVTATGSDTTYNYRANNLSDVANAATAFTNIKQAASDTATGVVELATAAEYLTGTDTTRVAPVSIIRSNQIGMTGSAAATGTSVDFTGIPSWVKRIQIHFTGVSGSGTSIFQIQIGDSGGIENTGYTSSGTNFSATGTGSTSGTAGFILNGGGVAASSYSGTVVINFHSSTTWVCYSVINSTTTNLMTIGAGTKALSAALDRVRVTTVNGTDTFDSGWLVLTYE